MKSMKRILAIILSVLMLFAAMPMTAVATEEEAYEYAQIIDSGECGLYVNWKLNSLGTLFLEKNGSYPATYDYPLDKSSPFRNDARIKKIIIREGVAYLGRMVFRDLPNLTEVVIEEGLQEMEFGVFSGCSSLTELELPESFNKFTTVSPFYGSSIKKLTFKGNELNTNTQSGYAWDRELSNVDIYVPLPFTLNGTELSTYEEAAQALGHNGNKVYCVNDNATVTWKDYDGTVLETDKNAAQGVIPTFDGETPSRPSDPANAYYFTGWTPEPREVTGDMVYTATYGLYGKASYMDENGEEQEVFARPLTGTETELPGGWYVVNQDITYSNKLNITGEANLILADGATLNMESGNILDVDETKPLNIYCQKDKSGVLSADTIVAGSVNMYGGNLNVSFSLAAKNAVNIFDGNIRAGYILALEKGSSLNILGGSVYVEIQLAARGSFTFGYKNPTDSIYTKNIEGDPTEVSFVDGQSFVNAADLSQIYTGTATCADLKGKSLVPYAHNAITYTPVLNGTVTGPSEADFGDEITLAVTPDEDYALDELTVKTADNETIEVVDNKFIMPATAVTVSATFISTKTYTVTWVVDGEVVETDENLPFGATPEYNGAVPQKDATQQYTYHFEGWSPAITPVASDVTYTAQFGASINTYHVRWVVEGETVETDSDVPYGATPEYNGATPQKAATAQFTYAFSGWSPEISPVTGDVTYTAQFTEVTNTYTVSWVEGGETVETDTNIPYGATPEYNGVTQDDYYDADHHYIFRGWSDGTSIYATHALPPVNADTVYTAVYTEAAHRFGEPVWEWANDGSSAVAHFTCTDCGYAVSVNASVSEQKQNLISIFSATAHFADTDYQNQKTVTRSCNLWISGTQVNGDNASDVFGDGSVSYDEMTNTLTLTDATLEVSRYNDDGAFAIRYNDSYALPLTIVLNGTNSIVDEAADNNVQAKYGVCAFASSPGYVVEGNGTLSISMSAEDDNIRYYGIHMRKPITVKAASVDIAIHGNAPATGVDLCYDDTVLSLTNGAAMNISTGANENSYALNSNRNVENLRVDDGCTFVACSQGTAFGNDINLSDATKALGAYVNAAAQSDGAVKWDASTDLTAYRYVKIPYVKGEHPEDGYSLTIDDSVKVNFYIDMPYYEAEGGYIEYTCIDSINEESARRKTVVAMDDSEEFRAQANGTRKLTLKAAPAQLAEKYEITVYDAQGVEKKRFEASMADYCEQLKNHERYGELCRALLNYGQHSNIFFDYASKHEDVYTVPTAEGFDADLTAGEKSTLAGKAVSSITPGDTAVKGVSYVALMDPELRFYLDASVSESQAAKTPVSITGTADGFAPQAEMVKTDSGICVRVTGLKANDFGKNFNLRIGTTEITYNGYAYLDAVITRTNPTGAQADLYNLAKSVYRYAVAAENTF